MADNSSIGSTSWTNSDTNTNSASQSATVTNNYQQTVKDMTAAGINPLALYHGAALDTNSQTNSASQSTSDTKSTTTKFNWGKLLAGIGTGLLACLL